MVTMALCLCVHEYVSCGVIVPNQVVASSPLARHAEQPRLRVMNEWLTANHWLPPLNETKYEEGKASARRNRCGAKKIIRTLRAVNILITTLSERNSLSLLHG